LVHSIPTDLIIGLIPSTEPEQTEDAIRRREVLADTR
jgi:hypothetical protein